MKLLKELKNLDSIFKALKRSKLLGANLTPSLQAFSSSSPHPDLHHPGYKDQSMSSNLLVKLFFPSTKKKESNT